MFDVRSLGMGLFGSGSLLLAAPAMPDGCAPGPGGGTGGAPTAVCGNRMVEDGEECDRDNLAFQTCLQVTSGDRDVGTLSCTNDCKLDTSGCRPSVCGDGKIEGAEDCEGTNLGQKTTCHEVYPEYPAGQLKCNSQCRYDGSLCLMAVCGDGRISGPEQCEGTNLNGKRCSDIFFATTVEGVPTYYSGTLACLPACYFDMTRCVRPPGCYWGYAGRAGPYVYCI